MDLKKAYDTIDRHGMWQNTGPNLLGPVFFRTALPCSGGYHLERSGMPLHDAVGINCKNWQLNIREQMSSKWAKGCILVIVCVLSDLT